MQVTNFCSEHGGEEAQSGRFICSLLGVSVETHLSTNLTAVLLFAIDATSAVAQVEDAKRSKANSAPSKSGGTFLFTRKAALFVSRPCLDRHQSHEITSFASQK
jgi:hypothetical protein